MVGAEHVPIIVEKCLGSGDEVDGAKDDANGSRIDPLEINRLSDQRPQFGGGDCRLLARNLG